MCESVAGRWDLGRTSHLSAPAVQFCAQGLLSAVLLCGCNTVAIASVYGGSQSSGSGFYVSCRGCRAIGIVGGQDPRQEPPSGSLSGTPVRKPRQDPRQDARQPRQPRQPPSTPRQPPSTPSTPSTPSRPRHGPSGPPSTDDNGVPTGSKRSTSLALILDMSLPNSRHTSVCMQMFRLTEHLPA